MTATLFIRDVDLPVAARCGRRILPNRNISALNRIGDPLRVHWEYVTWTEIYVEKPDLKCLIRICFERAAVGAT
jgi:hypothetical protein